MLRKIISGRVYTYYTQDEADERCIKYCMDWRSATAGEWALLDDGYIAEVLQARRTAIEERGQSVNTIRFPHGTYFGRFSQKATTEDRDCLYSATGRRTDFSNPDRRLSAKERKFVLSYLDGFDVIASFLEATDSNPASKSFRSRAMAYFRRANVQAAINEQLKAKLKGIGIDEEWWGAQIKRIIQEADRDIDRLRGLELVARALGLLDQKTNQTGLQGQPVDPAELETIQAESHP